VPNQDQAKRIRQDTFMRVARDIHNGVPVTQAFNSALNYKVEKEDKYQSDLNQWNIGANQRNGISSAVSLYLQNNPANDLNDGQQAFFAEQLHRVAHRKNFHNDVAPDQVRIGRHAEQIKSQLNDPVEFQQAKAAHTSIAALSAQLLNNLADNAGSQTVLNDLKDLALHAKAITGQDRFYGKDGVSNADDQRQVLQAHARDAVSNMSSNDARQLFLQLTRAGGLAHRLKAAGGDESLNINGAERYAMDRMMTGLDAMLTALAEQGGVVSGGQDILSLHALKPAPDEDRLQETGRAIINASSDIVAQLPNDFVQMLLGNDKEQSDASSIDLAIVKYRD
jgi:hypothetical protein